MKKVILTAFIALLANSVQADVIKCMFTEPFVATTYSMTQQTLTYDSAIANGADNGGGKVTVIKKVSFQIKSAGVFELVSKDGKVLQTLKLNNEGSNGMNDEVYPYDVKDEGPVMANNFGGCTSNYLKVIN